MTVAAIAFFPPHADPLATDRVVGRMAFLMFAVYTSVQYVFVEKWMVSREKASMQQNMNDILNYFLERESAFDEQEIPQIRNALNRFNQKDQLIRVLDEAGNPIISVSDNVDWEWAEPDPGAWPRMVMIRHENHSQLMMSSPLTIFRFRGTVEIVRSMDAFSQLIADIFRVLLVFGLVTIGLSGLGGWLLAGQLLSPLQSMAETILSVKRKGLHERMKPGGATDEISTLMSLFNRMMDQVERSFQQQSRFVEDASHELRTPIAIIEGHLALLRRWGKEDPDVLEESLHASSQELYRLKSLVQELLALTRAEQESPDEQLPLAGAEDCIRSIIRNSEVIHPSFDFQLESTGLGDGRIAVTAEHLEQIMLIILDNAVKYSPDSRVIRVSCDADKHAMRIAIADEGIGIPAEHLPRVTDRFYRVDQARSRGEGGHGLGLAIAKRLMERCGGAIAVTSEERCGTTVSLTFPVLSGQD